MASAIVSQIRSARRRNLTPHQRVELAGPDVDPSFREPARQVSFQVELGQVDADAVHLPEALRAVDADARGLIEAGETAKQPVLDKERGVMADKEIDATADVFASSCQRR